jgi:hypothetical protein
MVRPQARARNRACCGCAGDRPLHHAARLSQARRIMGLVTRALADRGVRTRRGTAAGRPTACCPTAPRRLAR